MGVDGTRDVVTLKSDGGFQTGNSLASAGSEDDAEAGAVPEGSWTWEERLAVCGRC